jgi:hypothetical protein
MSSAGEMIGSMPLADVISYLDRHQGAVTAFLTLALVLVTVFYAWQNLRMAREMREARSAAIRPKLALELHRLGPTAAALAIRNVGAGSALDVDVQTEWVTADDKPNPAARWRRNLLPPGEQAELLPPGDLNDNINSLPRTYREIRLVGQVTDAAGAVHQVDERFADLAEWREVLGDAHERWVPSDPEKRTADALYSKCERPLKDLTRSIQEINRAIYSVGSTDEDGEGGN